MKSFISKLILIGVIASLVVPVTAAAQDAGVRTPPAEETKKETKDTAVKKKKSPKEEMVYLNGQNLDIKDVIRQVSKATGKNFIIDDKLVAGKVTIMSERPMTKDEAYQAFLSALEVAGYTVVTGPGGIIKVVSTKNARKSPIPIHVDTTPYTDSFVTRLIPLENISSSEIQQVIGELLSPNGNAFAYPATNTIIITDSGTNIDRLMKLIKQLDQEGPQQTLDVIPIRYADAKEVAATVLSLFDTGVKKTTRTTSRRRGAAPQLEELKEVSQIIADDRTNSLIVYASKRGIVKIKKIIRKLDSQITGREGKIHVHALKYANAEEMATTLAALTSGSAAASQSKGKGAAKGGASAQLDGGINIIADEATNSLIITASPKDYQTLVIELINKLDKARRQVYLESIIMELAMQKKGDYSASGYVGKLFGTTMPFMQTFGAASSLFDSQKFFGQGGLLGGVLSQDQVSISMPTASGSSNTIQIPAFAAFLNLIQTYSDANIVSSPNILTLDNEEAEMNILKKIYAQKTTTTATSIVSTEPVPLEAGLILKITPQITEGNSVRLKISNELSNFLGLPTKDVPTPPQTSRKIKTTVIAQDGQTVVLGGLMQDINSTVKSKIPILGDIPLLGLLFRSTSKSKDKSNLLIFITPHVIKDPSDFVAITKKKLEERNRFIEDNYGKKQQRAISAVIASHNAELLNYSPPAPANTMPETSKAVDVEVQKEAPAKPKKKLKRAKKDQDVDLGY